MLAYLSKEKNEAIQKSVARCVALKAAKEAREKARRAAAVLREERAKERAAKLKERQQAIEEKEKAKAEKLKEKQQRKEEKARARVEKTVMQELKQEKRMKTTLVKKRNVTGVSEKVRYVTKSGSLYHAIPQKILSFAGWKRYTRFACTEDPENHLLVLEESIGEPTANQITLCSGCIKISNNTCHAVGWKAGDAINIRHEGKKIIMRRVV